MTNFIAKTKTIKLISTFLIIAMLAPTILLSSPKKAEATGWPVVDFIGNLFLGTTGVSTATNTAISVKNVALEILRQAIMIIERKLLQKMTQGTVNWINSGFHGSPLYLLNPDSFFNDIAKYEVKNLVSLFGYDSLRFPFGKDFALHIINNYKTTAEDNAQYSLSRVINDPVLLNNYRNNFNVGGWNGFLINTQYPQNNYLGFQMIATEDIAKKLEGTATNAAGRVNQALQQGMGFLSPQTCPSNPAYNNVTNQFQKPAWDGASWQTAHPFQPPENEGQYTDAEYETVVNAYVAQYDAQEGVAKAQWAHTNTCPGGLVNTTPGSVVANQITNAMGSQFRQSELGAALGNSISAVLDAFINHFMDKGLNYISDLINPPPSTDTGPGTCYAGSGSSKVPLPYLKTKDDCTSLGGTWTKTSGSSGGSDSGTCTDFQGTLLPEIKIQDDCTSLGGTWTSQTLPKKDVGTCTAAGDTSTTTEDGCDLIGGTWSKTLPVEPMGSCVVGSATSTTTQAACDSVGGTWTPTGAEPEGNCFLNNTNFQTTEAQCTPHGGVWTPMQTPPAAAGTCTSTTGTSTTSIAATTQLDCEKQGGEWNTTQF